MDADSKNIICVLTACSTNIKKPHTCTTSHSHTPLPADGALNRICQSIPSTLYAHVHMYKFVVGCQDMGIIDQVNYIGQICTCIHKSLVNAKA